MNYRTLAWLQLTSDRGRFAAALAGVAFAVAMMLFQLGLQHALLDRAVQVHTRLRADVVLVSRDYNFLVANAPFPRERLYQALGDAEAEAVSALHVARMLWRHPQTQLQKDIVALAFAPDERPLDLAGLDEGAALLKRVGSVLYDEASRSDFGPVAEMLARDGPFFTELNRQRVRVEGLFRLGPTFAIDANVAMSEETFFSRRDAPSREEVSVGIVRLRAGADAAAARDRLAARLPGDVQVLTRAEFIALERLYWARRTPIGFAITASMVVSLVVGAVVVYQILYTDVTDHLPEYATLKAIGYEDGFFAQVVLTQAAILSLAGFVPGAFAAAGLGMSLTAATDLALNLSAARLAGVLALTIAMCGGAGWLALRTLRRARPAEVF